MRIGIDLDGTITAHPEFFSKLSHLWDDDVYIITLRDDKEEAIQDAEKHNIKFTDVTALAQEFFYFLPYKLIFRA